MRFLSVLVVLLLSAGRYVEAAVTNLAINPGFEDLSGGTTNPPGWILFTTANPSVEISSGKARSGSHCLELRAQGEQHRYSGAFQTLPVAPDGLYAFTVHVLKNPVSPLSGGAEGRILIEWQTNEGVEVGRIEGKPWSRLLSAARWQEVTIRRARAPADAERANFCIHMSEEDEAGRGAYLLDDVIILREPDE